MSTITRDELAAPTTGTAIWALTRLDLRMIGRGGAVLTALAAGLSAIVVVQYAASFATPAEARSLQILAENPAIRALFGVPSALDTVGGFTVWRSGTILAIAAAGWGLACATRLTRGEEEAGRVWLTAAGPVPYRSALLLHQLVIAAGLAVLGGAVATTMTVAGTAPRGAVVYGAGITATGWLFGAIGALCGQLLDNRRAASGLAIAVLLVGMLLRTLADGVSHLAWAAWLTPFGLLALSAPYATDRWLPIGLLVAAAAGVGSLAWILAGRRDLGGSVIVARGRRPPRFRWSLGSMAGFAVRRTVPALVGWAVALSGYFLLVGLLADSLTDFLAENPRFADLAAQAGFAGLATTQGYAASLLRLLPIPLGLFVASRVAAAAVDETEQRLAPLLAGPVPRWRWAVTDAATIAASCLVMSLSAGLAIWVGTSIVGAGLRLDQALAGSVNGLSVVALSLGAAVLALGWAPRAVVVIGAAPTVGGFVYWALVEVLEAPTWVREITPFAHLAAVPAEPVSWAGVGVMLVLGAAWAAIGVVGFHRRDLRG